MEPTLIHVRSWPLLDRNKRPFAVPVLGGDAFREDALFDRLLTFGEGDDALADPEAVSGLFGVGCGCLGGCAGGASGEREQTDDGESESGATHVVQRTDKGAVMIRFLISFVACIAATALGVWGVLSIPGVAGSEWSVLIGFGVGLLGCAVFWAVYGTLTVLLD